MNNMSLTMNSTNMPGMGTGTGMPGMGTPMPGMGTPMPGMGTGSNGMNMNGVGGMYGMAGMGGMGNMSGMMQMYFHTGIMEYILFQQLHTHTKGEFALACIAVFFCGVLYEMIKFTREEMLRRHNIKVAQILLHGTHEEKNMVLSAGGRILSCSHLLQTVLHAVQIFISYCLMLIFMTYNAYLCLSLILGATTGYFCTGWKRTQVTDQNEHCH